jgi:hypothetical protein
MSDYPTRLLATLVLFILLSCSPAFALGSAQIVETDPAPGSFSIVAHGEAATLWLDTNEWKGVIRAARDFQSDVGRVTGVVPQLTQDLLPSGKNVIVVGTLGRSAQVEDLSRRNKIDVTSLRGKWEGILIQVVDRPFPGVDHALVIAGSDKRGTIYGLYDLSEQCGVSPWYWWADVPPQKHTALAVKRGPFIQEPPAVRYRGIFLNDEAPALSGWAKEKFGGLNHLFYTNVFELLLRLRANFLWPAMWNNSFATDDPLNASLADEYGIVIGTSHHEPMMRAWKEWSRAGNGPRSWDYTKNESKLRDYWTEGLKRTKGYEKIVTLGMRGDGDEPMSETESIALLQRIGADQRGLIGNILNPDVTAVPQAWALYKEVQGYFERGMRVPDDVTLLWCDDNWGNIRRLPTPEERHRSGGAGIYYHFDYVGGPRNYKWLNTVPLPKIWEQMNLAYSHEANRIWVVNVGDLKPMEIPIEFFLTLAWNPPRWTQSDLDEYLVLWATREFGPSHATEIAQLVARYTKYNGRRKPESLDPGTFSLVNYSEADRVDAQWQELLDSAQAISRELPESARDAFFELVLHPIQGCCLVNQLYIAAAKNQLYLSQGRASANGWAAKTRELFLADAQLTDYYHHHLAGGKWNHMMAQTHIGYTSWQEPPTNNIPAVRELELPGEAGFGVTIEGSTNAWPQTKERAVLPSLEFFGPQRRYLELFSRGKAPFEFQIVSTAPWLLLTSSRGTVTNDLRLWVSVDWDKAPAGWSDAGLSITGAGADPVVIATKVFNPSASERNVHGFIEADGCVAMEAAHYTAIHNSGTARWERLPDNGRLDSAMTIFPVTSPTANPPEHSPCLEYSCYLFNAGSVEVSLFLAPSLNYSPDRGVRIAVSIDEEAPTILTAVPQGYTAGDGNADWEKTVKDGIRQVSTQQLIPHPGPHMVKIWMVDPGVVLQRIVVNTGGVPQSFLGPPESLRR